METNKLQWKRIAEGDRLPCDALLMKKDGTILSVISGAGVKVGQDAYYLPAEKLKSLPKEHIAKICGWVARQPEGDLWLFAEPPYFNREIESWGTAIGGERELEGIDTTMFKDLHYYDEPIEVELIIKRI